MPSVVPNCACPLDSKVQTLAKINNNLVFIFETMSTSFVGRQVSLSGCGCSEIQILKTINDNIVEFAGFFSGGVDGAITSWAELAAIPTTDLTVGTIKLWVDSATDIMMGTQLVAGTEATDTASGVTRPDDYSASNEKYWANKLA